MGDTHSVCYSTDSKKSTNAFQQDAYRPHVTVWGVSLTETPLPRQRPPSPDRDPPRQRPPVRVSSYHDLINIHECSTRPLPLGVTLSTKPQPAIQATCHLGIATAPLRRLALSMPFTIATTSYQTTCTVSERTSIKGTRQCKPARSSSFALRHPPGQKAPCGQTHACENMTFANFVCGR